MNKFLPLTGGHPLQLDDLVLMENAYSEALQGIISYFDPSGNCILSGCVITMGSGTVFYTNGFVSIAGEVYKVVAGNFTQSLDPSAQIYFLPVQTVLAPSPDAYEDGGSKNVHFQRQVTLKYYNSSTDTGGIFLTNMLSPDAGKFEDWIPPTGTTVGDFFDATGLGYGKRLGWAICNGLNGTPDVRGMNTAGATNVPSTGASAIAANVSGITANIGDIVGFNKLTITQANLPDINFSVTDPGHVHIVIAKNTDASGSGALTGGTANVTNDGQATTSASQTGITVASGGSGTPTENRPATYYVYKIIKLN